MGENLDLIEKSLEYSFLYDNDAESMHILLSMLDHRYRLKNIQPKYMLMRRVNTAMKRALIQRRDREAILRALKKLLNDDINRFELALCIEVYAKGHEDEAWVDLVERMALRFYSPEDLASKGELFQNCIGGKPSGLKNQLFHDLKAETDGFRDLKKLSSDYCRRVLRKRIYRLNDYIDKQVMLDFNDLTRLKLEENNLTIRDLNYIYNKCNRYLYNNVTKVFKESYWNGINDAVLERYSR